MAMGSTGTVNITPEMMKNALGVIEGYQTNTTDLKTQLDEILTALIPSNFSGNAADGFNKFYTNKIVPAIDEGLSKLLATLHDIIQGTLEAIPDTNGLDDQLAEENSK